jgi:hypothetical protein
LTKNNQRRGLSTVLTTIIILVASVTLGAGVVLYGASLFQGSSQTESISVADAQLWVHGTDSKGLAWGAAGVRNTGDKVLAVDTIQVRGVNVPFTQWYPDTTVTPGLFQKSLNFTGWSNVNGMLRLQTSSPSSTACSAIVANQGVVADLDGAGGEEAVCASAASGPVSLSPGSQTIIYFKLTNGTLTSLDSGASTTLNIFAGKAGSPLSVTIQGKTNTG